MDQAVRALFEVSRAISEAQNLAECGAYLIDGEDAAVKVGAEMLDRLTNARRLALKHMAELSITARVSPTEVMNAVAPPAGEPHANVRSNRRKSK